MSLNDTAGFELLVIIAWACASLALPFVGLFWAIWRSKSRWGLLFWPVLVGWVGAALVSVKLVEFWGPDVWRPFLFLGVVCTVEGFAFGLVAALARTVMARFETKAKQTESGYVGEQQQYETGSPFAHSAGAGHHEAFP